MRDGCAVAGAERGGDKGVHTFAFEIKLIEPTRLVCGAHGLSAPSDEYGGISRVVHVAMIPGPAVRNVNPPGFGRGNELDKRFPISSAASIAVAPMMRPSHRKSTRRRPSPRTKTGLADRPRLSATAWPSRPSNCQMLWMTPVVDDTRSGGGALLDDRLVWSGLVPFL